MKAIVYRQYGAPEVLHIAEVASPVAKKDEVLVRVHATTVTSGDARVRALNMPRGFGIISRLVFGLREPRNPILGVEFSGVVAALGPDVTRFEVGAPVFGMMGARMGCYAEYVTISSKAAIAPKPANLSFAESAAMCFGGTTALDFFRRAKLQQGERLLVNGASGSVGSAAVQLAKHLGAHVTAVCSTSNIALVHSLGADAVIDYTQEDFTRSGQSYDLIMDTVGNAPFARIHSSLTRNGRFLMVLGGLPEMLTAPWVNMTSDKKIIAGPTSVRLDDVLLLAELAALGKYKPLIDRVYAFDKAVDAHALVDSGRKRGNAVIAVYEGAS